MCSSSTLSDIERQAQDKQRIRLSERFLSPAELLTRTQTFHANAEALSGHDEVLREFHAKRAREYSETLERVSSGNL